MLSKQRTKSELKQLVNKLTWKLKEGQKLANHDVEAERDEAVGQAEETEWQMVKLQWKVDQVKQELEALIRRMTTIYVYGRLKEAKTELVNKSGVLRCIKYGSIILRETERLW